MMRKLQAFAFLLVMLCGCAATLFHLIGAGSVSAHAFSLRSWLEGDVTRDVDQRVTHAVPTSQRLDRWLNGLLYAVSGDTGPQVRSGCPGWLFLAEEVVETPGGEDNLRQRMRLIQMIAAQFKEQHIILLALPVPDKVEQAQTQLCSLRVSAQARSRRLAWNAASAPLALAQIDLASEWTSPGYWRTDSHWDRQGARHAAQQLAARVAAILPAGDNTAMQLESAAGVHARPGDLVRLAGLAGNSVPYAPEPDMDHDERLNIQRDGGLLDDVAAPRIVLAGSSFSLNSGFADYLQLALHEEILQKSHVGSGFAGSLMDLLKQHALGADGVRLVIWEWPLRVLYQPLTDDERSYLLTHKGVFP
jgi:alginate O-acetyltransferase complex protein AlgJ